MSLIADKFHIGNPMPRWTSQRYPTWKSVNILQVSLSWSMKWKFMLNKITSTIFIVYFIIIRTWEPEEKFSENSKIVFFYAIRDYDISVIFSLIYIVDNFFDHLRFLRKNVKQILNVHDANVYYQLLGHPARKRPNNYYRESTRVEYRICYTPRCLCSIDDCVNVHTCLRENPATDSNDSWETTANNFHHEILSKHTRDTVACAQPNNPFYVFCDVLIYLNRRHILQHILVVLQSRTYFAFMNI